MSGRPSSLGTHARATHAHVRASLVDAGPTLLRGLRSDGAQIVAERGGHGDVTDNAVSEEGRRPDALGAIEQLIGNDHVTRFDVLFHDADGASHHAEHAGGFRRVNWCGMRGSIKHRVNL